MKQIKATTIADAKQEAKAYSAAHHGVYVTITACFGLFLSESKRLNVFAPSDSYIKCYWLNGVEKPFSEKQKIADQLATPIMS